MPKQIFVRKASGELVPFELEKVRQSLQRAYVDKKVIDTILQELEPTIKNGMSTRELYEDIYNRLKVHNVSLASKYNLKQAIMELGPTGYPFEQFLAKVLHKLGYQTWTNQMVKGHCVTHELDIVAERDRVHYMVETKYHNIPGSKTSIQAVLYSYARFLDVKDHWVHDVEDTHKLHRCWLVTNTKLTSDTIEYANCMGIELSGWDYPEGSSLRKLITASGAHPITSLATLKQQQKRQLLDQHVVLCSELLDMSKEEITNQGLGAAREEAEAICQLPVTYEEEPLLFQNTPKKSRHAHNHVD
jgi:hypothetical protein